MYVVRLRNPGKLVKSVSLFHKSIKTQMAAKYSR